MNRYCFQYHSWTLVSLSGRKEQQGSSRHAWAFDFPQDDVRIALSDRVKKANGINLHAGLNIIVDVNRNSQEAAEKTSKNLSEMLLNLVSFCTSASCDSAKLVSVLHFGQKEPHQFRCNSYAFEDREIICSMRVIEEAVFRTVFESYFRSWVESSDQQRIMRALSWLRKGVGEENKVDQFVSYWIGLEVIKHILRRNLRRKMRNPPEWAGVEAVFTETLKFRDFDKIKGDGRNGLLHGFRQLNDEFMKEIADYLEPVRKTLVCCIGDVLGLEDRIVLTIANKTPQRIPQDPWRVIEGELRNLPVAFNELVQDYPMLDAEIANKEFSIDQSGNLKIKFKTSNHFHVPSEVKWDVKAIELWGDRDAGVRHTDIG